MKTSKRILSAVLASTTALSSMVAYAEDTAETELTGLAKLIDEASEGGKIEFDADVTVSESINITKSLTIDLKGNKLTITPGKYIFVRGEAKVTITDSSESESTEDNITSGAWGFIARDGGTLTLENIKMTGEAAANGATLNIKNSTITGCTNYAVIAQSDSTVTITDSEINGHKTDSTIDGPAICIGNGTDHDNEVTVTVDNSKVTGGNENSAIYKPQKGTLTIKGENTLITGANGVSMKAGKLVVEGGTIKATGTYVAEVPNNSNGINESGSAIAVAENNAYAGNVEIDIKEGATVESTNGNAIRHFRDGAAYTEDKAVPEITCKGELKSAEGKSDVAVPSDKKVVKIGNSYEISDVLNINGVYGGKSAGNAEVDTMTGDNLANYKANLAKYEFKGFKAVESGFEVTCDVKVGEMKAATAGGAIGYKNVVAVLVLDRIEDFAIGNISRDGAPLTDASWVSDASKFILSPSNNKTYVTLWMSMVEGVDGKIPDRTYTIKATADDPNPKTLTVKFNDTTEYTLKNEMPDVDDCTVTASAVTNGKATVTVTPTADKFITGGTVAGVALAPSTGKAWSAEVDVKSLLTPEEIAAGTTEATLKTIHFSVTAAVRSDIEVADITAPSTSKNIEEEQNERFRKNLNLYKDAVTWDETSGIATVKVPSALMLGENTPGKSAANVCLVMKFKNTLTGDNGSYGIPSISDGYIEDGYTFADNTTAENKGEYAVLWISAHTNQFTNGTKTVVYTDSDGKVIATVKLVDVPVIKPANLSDISRVTLTSATDTNSIISAVKTKLGDKADLVSISVGDIPANSSTETTLDGNVTVTVSAANGKDVVFANADNEISGSLEVSVPVTVPQKTATTPANPGGSGSSRPSGGSSGGSGGSSYTPSAYLDVTNKAISSAANAVKDTVRVNANSSDSSGAAVKVAKSDAAVSYVKIDAPATTAEAAAWAEPIVKKASSDKLADVKKAAEEAINAVANNKGFALNIDILNADRKTVVPGKNVVVTVPMPSAYHGKTLYAYHITERGVVPILASAANNKITFNAGGSGEYIFTTERLANAITQKKGDVDNGGTPNAADATLVLKHVVELNTLKDEQLYFADVNGDGTVNAKDATEILKIVVGLA